MTRTNLDVGTAKRNSRVQKRLERKKKKQVSHFRRRIYAQAGDNQALRTFLFARLQQVGTRRFPAILRKFSPDNNWGRVKAARAPIAHIDSRDPKERQLRSVARKELALLLERTRIPLQRPKQALTPRGEARSRQPRRRHRGDRRVGRGAGDPGSGDADGDSNGDTPTLTCAASPSEGRRG